MSDASTDTSPTTETPPPPAPNDKRHVKTAIFVAILVGVVAVFQALNVYADPPPDLPANDVHKLMFNTQNALIGLGDPSAWPTHDANGKAYPLDKKSIERRVNLTCASCHGAPAGLRDEDFSAKNICAVPDKCLLNHETHPQKSTCIKCHRMPPKGTPTATGTETTGGAKPTSDPAASALASPTPAAVVDGGAAPAAKPVAAGTGGDAGSPTP